MLGAGSEGGGRSRAIALLILGLGCGGPPELVPPPAAGTTAEGELGSSESSGSSTTAAFVDGPPTVIDIGRSELTLREGESMVLTAVVRDPDDDVISGQLFGPGTASAWAIFEPHGGERWRVELSWDAVHLRYPLEFHLEQPLPLVARFVDASGHEAEGEIEVRATCGGIRDHACNGECVDIQTSAAHCDGCDQPCPVEVLGGWGPTGGCTGGLCQPLWSTCIRWQDEVTCADLCAAKGRSCVAYGCGGATSLRYEVEGVCGEDFAGDAWGHLCDAPVTSPFGYADLRCCCL